MPDYKGTEYHLRDRGDSVQGDFCFKGKRHRKNWPDARQAAAWVEAMLDRLMSGQEATPPTVSAFASPTLSHVYKLVYDKRWKGKRGEATAVCNAMDCVNFLGTDTAIDAITTEMIDTMVSEFKDRELTDATIRRKLAAVSTILKFAASRHWLKAMPFVDRSGLKENSRTRYLSDEEDARAVEYLRNTGRQSAADLVSLLIDTGFRLSEAIRLEWRDAELDPQSGEVPWVRTFQNKADHPRSVPTTARVKDMLKRRWEARPAGERRVFHDLTVDAAQWAWECVRANQKMTDDPEFVLHCCRHTFASRLAMAGVSIAQIKQLGGWKTLAMVMRYAHLCPDNMVEAVKKMEDRSKLRVG